MIKRSLTFLLFCTIILRFSPLCPYAAASEKVIVCFYSSETNINNFKSLKMAFDNYLIQFGAYEFQPFEDRNIFEKHIRNKNNILLLMSSWHYKHIFKEHSLQPVLAGEREGKKYHNRVLVVKGRYHPADTLSIAPVASASSRKHTRNILKEILDRNSAAALRILPVPKDVDALISVGFGMSKSALTMANSLEKLKKLNPVLFSKLSVVGHNKKNMLLILAVPQNISKEAEKMIEIIYNLPVNDDGKKKMKMLGLDGWQKVNKADKLNLES